MNPLWVIRILFLSLCVLAGYALSQMQPDWVTHGYLGTLIGFGFGGLLIAVDEMLKGFSLRAFSATTFGLLLGMAVALLIEKSGLFENADPSSQWLIRLGLFLGFGYIGMILAMRSNKEDFSLIIPYVRFSPQNKPDNLLLLDTSVIIDGRVADLIEARFIEGLSRLPTPATPSSAPAAGAALRCSTASSTIQKSRSASTTAIFPRKMAWTPSSSASRAT